MNVDYKKERLTRRVKGVAMADLPEHLRKQAPRRIMMPKSWTLKQTKLVQSMYNDDAVKFIVFPMTCIKKSNVCKLSKDIKMHTVLFVYNKVRCELEYWDDMFGVTQITFDLNKLMRTDIVQEYWIPILRDTFNFKFTSTELFIPKFTEPQYVKIKRILQNGNLENNYRAIYTAYLVDYIKRRVLQPQASTSQLASDVKYAHLLAYTMELRAHKQSWNETHRCNQPLKIVNTESGRCINVNTKKAREVLGLSDTCKFPQVRNIETMRCKKLKTDPLVRIEQHFVEANDSSEYLKTHVGWKYWPQLMDFLTSKFPFMATTKDNSFSWEKSLKSGSMWTLKPPKRFKQLFKRALTDSKISFIVYFVTLTELNHANYHSNCLIIDKNARTVERFEPTDPTEWPDFNNGAPLDNALTDVFKEYHFTYIPMMDTCPIGFQQIEDEEDAERFATFGGNCMMWSIFYMYIRLSNPHIPRHILIRTVWKQLNEEGSYKQWINGFHSYLLRSVGATGKVGSVGAVVSKRRHQG